MKKNILSGLSFFILAICWLIPDHFPPWTAYHTEAPAFAAIALIGIALIQYKNIKISQAEVYLIVLLLAFSARPLFFHEQYTGDALVGVAYIGLISIAHKWIQIESVATKVYHSVQLFLIWVAIVVSFQVLCQQLQISTEFGDLILEPLSNGRARANLGQPNQAATSIVLGAVAVLALNARKQLSVASTILVQIYFAVAIAATQSRTAILSELMVFIYLNIYGFRWSRSLFKSFFTLMPLLFLSFGYWLWVCLLAESGGGELQVGLRMMPGTRELIWKQFAIAIVEKPFFGWGWGQLAAAQQFGANAFPGVEQANYAHNIILDSLVTFGMPFSVFVIICVFRWFFKVSSLMQRNFDAYWALAMLMPLMVHSLLELPHAYSYFLVIAAVLVGFINSCEIGDNLIGLHKSIVSIFCLAWIILIISIAYEYCLVEGDFRINRFENRRIGVTPSEYVVPKIRLLNQYGDLLSVMRMRATPNMPMHDVLLLEKVSERFGWAPLIFRSILASALNGRVEISKKNLLVLKNLFPSDVYDEARRNIITLTQEKYPQLVNIDFVQ